MIEPSNFYDAVYSEGRYASYQSGIEHYAAPEIRSFLDKYGVNDRKCLEVGSGRGSLQNLVTNYTGTDLSTSVAENYQKPFFPANAESLPFDDDEFDVIWSITVLEHVPEPERALAEMRRVLKNAGLLFLKPAWNCRPWNCEGIPVRPYHDLSARQKLIKFSLPIRGSLAYRGLTKISVRLGRSLTNTIFKHPRLKFKRLAANYSVFWMVDSDACSSIEPFDAILWFRNQGDVVETHQSWRSALLSRSEPLVVRIKK